MLSSRVSTFILETNQIFLYIKFLRFGPIFGAGADLLFSNGCNTNMDSYSNLPHSYDGTSSGSRSLFGDYNFSIMDYEVYTSLVVSPSIKSKHERS